MARCYCAFACAFLFQVPRGFALAKGDWHVNASDDTDDEGWQYASNSFGYPPNTHTRPFSDQARAHEQVEEVPWSKYCASTSMVRRRMYIRELTSARMASEEGSAGLLSPTSKTKKRAEDRARRKEERRTAKVARQAAARKQSDPSQGFPAFPQGSRLRRETLSRACPMYSQRQQAGSPQISIPWGRKQRARVLRFTPASGTTSLSSPSILGSPLHTTTTARMHEVPAQAVLVLSAGKGGELE